MFGFDSILLFEKCLENIISLKMNKEKKCVLFCSTLRRDRRKKIKYFRRIKENHTMPKIFGWWYNSNVCICVFLLHPDTMYSELNILTLHEKRNAKEKSNFSEPTKTYKGYEWIIIFFYCHQVRSRPRTKLLNKNISVHSKE